MDPDKSLPWPNPKLVLGWWEKNRTSLKEGVRHLVGRPIDASTLKQVLITGSQKLRAASALELAILKPGQPLFEVRAPAWWQK
jgi:hypothetical protein